MEILIEGVIGATIGNLMKDIKNTKNIILLLIFIFLASVVAES